jgi:hypothetical protein
MFAAKTESRPPGEQNEFSGMTLRELARATLERAGDPQYPARSDEDARPRYGARHYGGGRCRRRISSTSWRTSRTRRC